MDLIEYKCPKCGGAIAFDGKAQKLVCPYCDTSFDPETLKVYDEVLNAPPQGKIHWDMPVRDWQEGEQAGMLVYTCNSCGGEIVADQTLGATSCPYCGNPVVMAGQFAGTLRPDFIIPFKLDKAAATAALTKHYNGKILLPKLFKSQNHIDEIKGLYIPFWLFDCAVHANIHYEATKVKGWSDSRFAYTETSHYLVTRIGDIAFDRVPVDGSSKMPDDLMESVEPFDYKDMVDFQTAYMAGYLANKYDVDADASIEHANARVKNNTEAVFAATVQGFSTFTPKNTNIKLYKGGAHYALLPVWILNTTWRGKHYSFAMNGQTGKLAGDLPLSKTAFCLWFGGIFALTSALVYMLELFVL